MQFLQTFAGLFANFGNLTWQMVVMWVIGGLLIYLAIAKKIFSRCWRTNASAIF